MATSTAIPTVPTAQVRTAPALSRTRPLPFSPRRSFPRWGWSGRSTPHRPWSPHSCRVRSVICSPSGRRGRPSTAELHQQTRPPVFPNSETPMQPDFRACSAWRACALLVALAQAAPGAEEAPAGAAPQYGEEIQVTAHYENAVGSSEAASAGTITRELVEDRPILRPGEVLELVPGLIITQHSGAGKANQYFLRGFNLDHGTDFLTTLDGMPINLRT